MKNIDVLILMGLPGSGKTTWASMYAQEINSSRDYNRTPVHHIQLDYYMDENHQYMPVSQILKKYGYFHWDISGTSVGNTIIIDGLFLTNKNVIKFVKQLRLFFEQHKYDRGINLYIHYWKENREACLSNDNGRRDLNSATTIKHATFAPLDIQLIKDGLSEFNITVMEPVIHEVKVATAYEKFFAPLENSWKKDGKLHSSSWSRGGHWGDCWGNSGSISADPQPDFNEFDELLEKVAPNITHLQYKKLYRECVSIREFDESGYYGSWEDRSEYELDLKKCHDMLKEMGYINE